MTTHLTMATVRARIFTLPDRPDFMISDDLAEFYQTTPKNLMQAVRRNMGRFPEDFIFEMTKEEFGEKLPHFGATSQGRRHDLTHYGFTKEGALQLSSVLTGTVADEVSVTIIRAFAELERQALESMNFLILKLQHEEVSRKKIRVQVCAGMAKGMTFKGIQGMGNYSGPKVAGALRECLALGLISHLPKGMPDVQVDLFGNA